MRKGPPRRWVQRVASQARGVRGITWSNAIPGAEGRANTRRVRARHRAESGAQRAGHEGTS